VVNRAQFYYENVGHNGLPSYCVGAVVDFLLQRSTKFNWLDLGLKGLGK
jgi:hypothetical protein